MVNSHGQYQATTDVWQRFCTHALAKGWPQLRTLPQCADPIISGSLHYRLWEGLYCHTEGIALLSTCLLISALVIRPLAANRLAYPVILFAVATLNTNCWLQAVSDCRVHLHQSGPVAQVDAALCTFHRVSRKP
jgi:hypothetical protein